MGFFWLVSSSIRPEITFACVAVAAACSLCTADTRLIWRLDALCTCVRRLPPPPPPPPTSTPTALVREHTQQSVGAWHGKAA